jgi:ATP-dependent DNA helicase 2 subunit 1
MIIYVAPDEMIDTLKPIVDKLHMKGGFDPNKFNNPELERFYDVLQSLAFEKEAPLGVDDLTVPKYTTINRRVGNIIEAFNDVSDQQSAELLANYQSRKPTTSRRARGSGSSDSLDIKSLWEQGKLKTATVDQLKTYIQSTGAKPTRLKTDLINQVEEYLSSN